MNEVQYSSEVFVHPIWFYHPPMLTAVKFCTFYITAVNIPQFSSLYLMVILDSSQLVIILTTIRATVTHSWTLY